MIVIPLHQIPPINGLSSFPCRLECDLLKAKRCYFETTLRIARNDLKEATDMAIIANNKDIC